MSCDMFPPGVRFNDCLFTEPIPLTAWNPPACPGILAILARNAQWAPKPLQPLYVGEFGNDGARGATLPLNVPREDLLVSILPMPFSTTAQRRTLCDELIAAYNPTYQPHGELSATQLVRKVDELETRQREQSQQILALLTNLGKIFEPQPVAPRKAVGFLPAQPSAPSQATETGS